MILCFSGCGNSRFVSEYLGNKIGTEIFSINDGLKKGIELEIHDDIVIICFPVYFGRMPDVLEKYLENYDFLNKSIYFIGTYYESPFDTESFNRKWCLKHNYRYLGSAFVKMPQVHATLGKPSSKEEADKINADALPVLDSYIEVIKEGKSFEKRKYPKGFISYLIQPIANKIINSEKSKKYTIDSSKCIGCGTCANHCFLNNIILENNKAKYLHKDCCHCNGCINICPQRAIEYKNKTKKIGRYFNTENPIKTKIG